MQGFKNLIPRSLLEDDSVQPLVKKTDQHRKTVQTSLQHFYSIYKNIDNFDKSFEMQIFQLHHDLTETQCNFPQYYLELTQLFKNVNVELKIFSEKTSGSYKQLNNVCNALFLDYSNVVLNFQQHIRNYQSTQQIVFEMSKRYSRNFKNMVSYLESYKSSFTDARLIYNNEEKMKRYSLCETTYNTIVEDLKAIKEKCQKLTERKINIKENFRNINAEMKRTMKVISSKLITQTKSFVNNYSQFQKTIVTFLAQKKFSLQKLSLPSFFQSMNNAKYLEYFDCQIKPSECQLFPAIFIYTDHLKTEYIPFCKSAFLNYMKQANQKVQKRKQINRKILQFLKVYIKSLQKANYYNLKDIISNFQKIKKKLSELFGGRFVSFFKSIHAIFELSIGNLFHQYLGIHEKMLKSINSKLKNIDSCFNEENKHMDIFIKQLRTNIQKFVGKKQFKKQDSVNNLKQDLLNASTMLQDPSLINKKQFLTQIRQRSQFLIHLITGFVSKLQQNEKSIKIDINSIINDFSTSTNQFYSLCCEYETVYFGSEQFLSNYKKYQTDIEKQLEKQSTFIINQLNFKDLLEQDKDNPITFDGQMNKIEEFKKLKKPMELDNESRKSLPEKHLNRKLSAGHDLPFDLQDKNGVRTPPSNSMQNNSGVKDPQTLSESRMRQSSAVIGSSGQKDKYRDYLMKKITFGQGQQFVKSFSCAFYDKIILQGRLYITTGRICFHSKFNSNNVFFGGTFIQIPKKDITKIQKRYNALIFDNSLAITTVNGQMFFTSFFSRDQAYDLIIKSLDINLEQEFFQPEFLNQQEDQLDKSFEIVQQEDDLKPQKEKIREQELKKLLQQFPYQLLLEAQIQVPKITAIKYFRIFDSGQEINHNRRTHSSFLQYCKDSVGHKQVQIHHFKPNILEYINNSNIQQDTPIKIQRKLNAMVPISASGVPFMPKAARSDEVQALYFISKNKYIVESTIQNSGAPYTDCFNVKLKRTIQSIQENKIKTKVEMYVNFVKSTMMKGMIQSKALEQTKAYFSKMIEQQKKYFKNLQKARKPVGNANNTNKGVSQEQYQQLRKETDELIEQKQKMTEKMSNLEQKQKNLLKYLIGSIVLNIFLIMLLVN